MNLKTLFRKKTVFTQEAPLHGNGLKKHLGVIDLTSLGIAAILGAGVFSTIGNAAAGGGPAVSFLFIFTSVACGFTAMCYAQFAARIPLSGSAYTYAYASFGELIAWIIGWDLVMEYAIGNIAVAISWSDYFTSFLADFKIPAIGWDGFRFPQYLSMDYLSAYNGHAKAVEMLAGNPNLESLSPGIRDAYLAWTQAPSVGSLKLIADFPALLITFIITWLVYIGIKESKRASNLMVLFKILIVLAVIVVGFGYVDAANWTPFAPKGWGGVLSGVSAVFFAYIGFDAISTTAEECRNPSRDLPRAMIWALLICTVLYILISLVLTGLVPFEQLAVGDPLAYAFEYAGIHGFSGVIAFSSLIAMASVLLVFQLGQPRIWMSMSRDGLLPPVFSRIHPKFGTPSFSTVITGLVVALPALFLNLTQVTDLTSIGTLFAFLLVCGGILLQGKNPGEEKKFRVPFLDGRIYLSIISVIAAGTLAVFSSTLMQHFEMNACLEGESACSSFLGFYATEAATLLLLLVLNIVSFYKPISLIPALGVLCNFFLILQLGLTNWIGFGCWLFLGLLVYLGYGLRNSKLSLKKN